MPRPSIRRSKWKLVRTPGGGLALRVVDKRHDYPKCALCKRPLHGFPKMTSREERRGHRPPTRIYGGYLCPTCLKVALKSAVDALYTSR
ncbi:MAG: hypothetical protein QW448_02935 [Thermofilaceae archaeon]